MTNNRDVIICDVTLRDGNQALAKPWSINQKIQVFNILTNDLHVPAIEVGYPGASDLDFQGTETLAKLATPGLIIGALARCNERDIRAAARALQSIAPQAIPRLHVFIGLSPFHMTNVLRLPDYEVQSTAVKMVTLAAELMKPLGGQVQFSPEHFGDCRYNLPWVIETLDLLVKAGAGIINLPNTVERTSPEIFGNMVNEVCKVLPLTTYDGRDITVSAHCHNDLGMATATSLKAFQCGARQIEVALNGLGERAGNASLQEVVVNLELAGVKTGIRLERLYDASLIVSDMSQTPIGSKTPLIGKDVLIHRSGIHQHGALCTEDNSKGAYRPIDPKMIGRIGAEECEFTSQSGTAGLRKILADAGLIVSVDDALTLLYPLKNASDTLGLLTQAELVAVYGQYRELAKRIEDEPSDDALQAMVLATIRSLRNIGRVKLINAIALAGISKPLAQVTLRIDDREVIEVGIGDGPVSAVIDAIGRIESLNERFNLIKLEIANIDEGAEGQGSVKVVMESNEISAMGHAVNTDIITAAAEACVQAINEILNLSEDGGILEWPEPK